MISRNTISAFPAQLEYPITKRQILPDFRDVFPAGFGAKEPYSFPQGFSVINATASRARALAAAAATPQTGSSGGGVVSPPGQVTNTTAGPPGSAVNVFGGNSILNKLGSITIAGKQIPIIVVISIAVTIVAIILMLATGPRKWLR